MKVAIEVRRLTPDPVGGELVDELTWEVRRVAGQTIELAGHLLEVAALTAERVRFEIGAGLELRGDAELAPGERASVRLRAAPFGTQWELRVLAISEVDARALPGGTSIERDLLAAIAAAPDEDMPRLVYADWLMSQPSEADHRRGELMQVQIALGASPGKDLRRALREREHELLAQLPTPVIAPGITLAWHRGFLERCALTSSDLVAHANVLFLVAPMLAILDVKYVVMESDFRRLAHVAELAGIRELSVESGIPHPTWTSGNATGQIATHLPGLRRLRAPNMSVSGSSVREILASRACPQLSVLDLSRNELGRVDITALAESTRLQPRVLRLAGCQLDAHHAETLALAPWLAEVEELDLGDNAIGDRGAFALATVKFRRLRRLALGSCGISAHGFAQLVGSRHVARLVHLRIHQNPIGDAGLRALAETRMRSIADLDAQSCDIGDAGIAALAATLNVRAARSWRLGGNRIGDRGARAILESPHLRDLAELDLSRCPIEDEALLARLPGV